MRHRATVFAPAGTPLSDRTVGEVVAERPSLARIFQTFGIDFCCHGGRTLRAACTIKGVAIQSVLEQLEAGYAEKEESETNPALLPPMALIYNFTPPPEVCNTYRALFAGLAELEEKLHRQIHLENSVLFPQVLAIAKAE